MSGLRVNWSREEVQLLLSIFKDHNINSLLDQKKYRKDTIYETVCKELAARGFNRNILQVKSKWRELKRSFFHSKSHNNISGNDKVTTEWEDDLSELLSQRPSCVLMDKGLDSSRDLCPLERKMVEAGVQEMEQQVDQVQSVTSVAAQPTPSTSTSAPAPTPVVMWKAKDAPRTVILRLQGASGSQPGATRVTLRPVTSALSADHQQSSLATHDRTTPTSSMLPEPPASSSPIFTSLPSQFPSTLRSQSPIRSPSPSQFPSILRSPSPIRSTSPSQCSSLVRSPSPVHSTPARLSLVRSPSPIHSQVRFSSQVRSPSPQNPTSPARTTVSPRTRNTSTSDEDVPVVDEASTSSAATSPRRSTPRGTDRSKGRSSYAKALNSFHDKWVASQETFMKQMLQKQEELMNAQLQEQLAWEEREMAKHRAHMQQLVESSNNVIASAVDRLIASAHVPSSVPPYGMHFPVPVNFTFGRGSSPSGRSSIESSQSSPSSSSNSS